MKSGVVFLVVALIFSASALAVNVRFNEEFSLGQNETALLAGTSVKITLKSLEAPNCVSGSLCARKAVFEIRQAAVPDQEISLYEGDSREILKLPLFLDSSELTFPGMNGNKAVFIVQTLQILLEKNSFLPREPVIIRARNTGSKPLTIVEGGECNPAYSIFRGEKYLKLAQKRSCPPGIGRSLLHANETKIIGTWDQKYYDKCKTAQCDGDYVEQGDYFLLVNKIKMKISVYDPNNIYIIAEKENPSGAKIPIAVQNMGNSIVEIETSPGCVSGFKLKGISNRQLTLNPPGKCAGKSLIKLLPGHYRELAVWDQTSYESCSDSACSGVQVPEGTYTIEISTPDGKTVEKDIVISKAEKMDEAPSKLPPEEGLFARLWNYLFG